MAICDVILDVHHDYTISKHVFFVFLSKEFSVVIRV